MSAYSQVNELYTPFTAALTELAERRTDKALQSKVEEFFAPYPNPDVLKDGPSAVMSPALVSPNLEMRYFLDIQQYTSLPTVLLEFSKDKFAHINNEKRALAELIFYTEDSLRRKQVVGSERVVDFQKYQGKPMNEVVTSGGEMLTDFHHRIFREYFKCDIPIYDFSSWFSGSYSFSGDFPYLRFLGLFIVDAILFGNFTTSSYETAFTEQKVLPAFRKIKECFGVAPLIVPIAPAEVDDEKFWCYYPEEIRKLI